MSEVGPTSTTDRALLKAFRAWGVTDFAQVTQHLSPRWRARLRSVWDEPGLKGSADPWGELRRVHVAAARPDPERVHASWYVRALRAESEAVKLAVTANAHPSIQPALLRELEIDPERLKPDTEPDPEAIGWVMSLWAERVVGALPEDNDPPVIVALTRLSSLDMARLVKVCGLVKHAFTLDTNPMAPIDESFARFTPIDRVRLSFFRRRIGAPDPRLGPLARQDLQYIEGDRKRAHLRLGLVTIGRLLDETDLERSRWAVQHVPYSVAKLVRRRMLLPIPRRAIFAWESWVLECAWARLLSEQRMSGGRDWLPENEEGEVT